MRKVDIRARVRELDQQLAKRAATEAAQRPERARLVEACRLTGDHDFERQPAFGGHPFQAATCLYCGVSCSAKRELVRRNLVCG
jgi:hypothetical protein